MSTAEQIPIQGTEAIRKPNGSAALMRIIEEAATNPAIDAAKLSTLLDVKLKWEAEEARRAYIESMQQFKRSAPKIIKTKTVSFAGKGGDMTHYQHAELHVITDQIIEALLAVGITHSWRCSDQNGRTTVTCVLTHELGHSEDAATLSGPADTSGGKNNIQAIGSTVSYLERYTLLAATGLAAKGQDDDGKTEGMTETAIDEYCTTLKDSSTMPELQANFKKCWELAKSANDRDAQERFRKVYEAKKRELWEHKQ